MNENSRILVAGGSGLVGSSLLRNLKELGATNVIAPAHGLLELTEESKVQDFFKKERPEYVFLAAAKVGGIKANATYPAEFIHANLSIQTTVLNAAFQSGVDRLIFFGSNCVYPKNCPQPMREEYLMSGPLEQTSEPYAVAKIAGMKMCEAYNRQYGTRFLTVIPPTLYGPHDNYDQQTGHALSAFVSRFHQAKETSTDSVQIWGSGSPRREFLYVDDLAAACIFLMKLGREALERTVADTGWVINVGSSHDLTILDLANKVSDLVGFHGQIMTDPVRPDGAARKLLDSSRITSLGWSSQVSLEEGLDETYSWYRSTLAEVASGL